jgi:carbon-monoxide dehydrogenase large subunit
MTTRADSTPDATPRPAGHGAARGIGASIPRKEDARFLAGRGSFVGDLAAPRLLECAFLRSPVAHARVVAVRIPGAVRASVFLNADLAGVGPIRAESTIPGYKPSDNPVLAEGIVRYVGEPIAMCVAPTRAQAEDIAQSIEVEFDPLPVVTDMLAAREPGSPLVHASFGDNLFLSPSAEVNFPGAAAQAAVVVEREYRLSRQCMVPLEGKAVMAQWDDRMNQLVVHTSTQVPHLIRTGLATFLRIDQAKIRVIAPDVGGGFGYKCVLHAEEVAVSWAAMRLRRPVRWLEDRREHLVTGANTRQHHYRVKAYADARGRLLALDAEVTIDNGAYSLWPFAAVLEAGQATGNLPGPYDFRSYRCRTFCVATNKPGFMPYRGVARTGVCFAMELTIDAIARAVGREPSDVRIENLVPAAAMPYTNVVGKHYDSGDYAKSVRLAMEHIGFAAVRERQRAAEPDGRLIGAGIATYTEQSAHGTRVFAAWGTAVIPGYEQAAARLTPDGGLEVRVGVQSHGQGMETTLAQIAHEVLGIDPADIQVVHGDTGLTPYSTGTYASRSIVMAGGAVSRACQTLRERIVAIGAHLLDCSLEKASLEKGAVVGPSGTIPVARIAEVWYLHPEQLPPNVDPGGLEAVTGYKPKVDTGVFSYSTHACVVAVDPETGAVEILDYVVAEDCGTMVNPMIVDGQTIGGAVQGIGTALYEESPYDETGQPLASTFADYTMPAAPEMPHIRVVHMVTPSPFSEHGVKGMGEGGAIAPPAAIANAINDALRPLGAEVNETPMTPGRVLAAIRRARAASGAG